MNDTLVDASTSLVARLSAAIDQDKVQLPPLPELTMRLQSMLADEDVETRKIAELIHPEPAIVASLMRVANSAAFGGLRQVTDLNQAIARLGLCQVGSIVTALLMKGHFETDAVGNKKQLLRTLWDHSVATAFICRKLADKVGVDPEEAFLAGLLHDCGRLLVLKAIDHDQLANGTDVTDPVRDELMDVLHATLGHKTLMRWKLPEAICQVALRHEEHSDGVDEPLLVCTQAADLITQKLGCHLSPDPDLTLLSSPAVEYLGLSDIELAELVIDLEDELDDLRKLF